MNLFIRHASEYANASLEYTNVMFTMGDDFRYQIATQNFQNIDKLIKHVNAKSRESNVRTFYSTPSCYMKAINKADITWPSKTDDFFPYQG